MSEELKPCPFCGSSRISFSSHQIGIAVGCDSCGAVSEIKGSKEQCAEAWNRRAQPADAEVVQRYCFDQTGCDVADNEGPWVSYDDHLAALSAVTAERDRLQTALSAPDTITAEPAGDYDNLRKQFLSLRMLANSNAKMVHHWRAQCGRETRETLLANAASVNAERDTNSMLTDALETAERERDQLRAEVEGLRKERDRFRAEVKSLLDAITAMAEERDRIRVEVEALRSVAREFAGFFSSDEPRHWELYALADAAAMAAKESTHEE